VEQDERQRLMEQRAVNGQTLTFVADRQAEMASTADELAKEDPAWSTVAAMERERRKTLMEMALEEKRLATEINLVTKPACVVADAERDLRAELLEIARAESDTAADLQAKSPDDPMAAVLAEQAARNRELLQHVAETAMEAADELGDSRVLP
jgi:hypothetical protein